MGPTQPLTLAPTIAPTHSPTRSPTLTPTDDTATLTIVDGQPIDEQSVVDSQWFDVFVYVAMPVAGMLLASGVVLTYRKLYELATAQPATAAPSPETVADSPMEETYVPQEEVEEEVARASGRFFTLVQRVTVR